MSASLASRLLRAGVPVVVLRPCKGWGKPGACTRKGHEKGKTEFHHPKGWATVTADECRSTEYQPKFRPGLDALAMVSGHGIDVVDVDTKANGSVDHLPPFKSYGRNSTPSGGAHYAVPSSGIGKISPLDTDLGHVGDYCGGTPEGEGRLLVYLPGSTRPKYPDGGYAEEEPWDLDSLLEASPDPDLVAALRASGGRARRPDRYIDTSPVRHELLGPHPAARAKVESALAALRALGAKEWEEGDHWRVNTFKHACVLIEYGNSNWSGYDLGELREMYDAAAPADGVWDYDDNEKVWDGAMEKVSGGGVRNPDAEDPADVFDAVEDEDGDGPDWSLLGDVPPASGTNVNPGAIRGVISRRIAANKKGAAGTLLPAPDAPAKVASKFLKQFVEGGCVMLRTWHKTVYEHAGTHWREISEESLMVELQSFTVNAKYLKWSEKAQKEVEVPWNPNDSKKRNLLNAIKHTAGAYILPDVRVNSFFDCADGCDLGEGDWLSFTNGLFDVKTDERRDHSPVFFNTTMRPFAYDLDAPDPELWLKTLKDYWGHEEDGGAASIDAFQEQIGFLVFGRNADRLKAIVVWQGPGDCGKSVLVDMVGLLLGDGGLKGLHPKTFVEKFGREVLLDAEVGVFNEADFTGVGRAAAGLLKDISGFDVVNINKKNKGDFSGKVNARLLMATNHVPRLDDASGAVNNRLDGSCSKFTRTFTDEEKNLNLLEELGAEFNEIAMWALRGYKRALARGRLVASPSGRDLAAEIAGKSAPLATWLDERVVLDRSGKLATGDALLDYDNWCSENNLDHAPRFADATSFTKAIKDVRPGMASTVFKDKKTKKSVRGFVGYRLVEEV